MPPTWLADILIAVWIFCGAVLIIFISAPRGLRLLSQITITSDQAIINTAQQGIVP